MSSLPRKLWKWIAGTGVVLVILLGLGLGMFRLLLAQVPDYRAQIQAFISERSGLNIAFSTLDARWRFYGPEVVFENAVLSAKAGGSRLVEARRGSVALDIWASLASGRITTGRFWLDAPQLNLVRTAQGRIELVGQDELPERTQPFRFDELPTGRFSISNARINLRDQVTGKGPWTFARVALTLNRRAGSMDLEGTTELPSALGRQLKVSARSRGQLDDPTALNWDFAVESRDLALASLGDLVQGTWPLPATGNGSFKLTGVLKGLSVTSLNGTVSLTGVQMPLPRWTTPLPGPDPLILRDGADATVASDAGVALAPVVPVIKITAQERVAYDVVRARFDLQQSGASGWHLAVDDLQLVRPGMRWDPTHVELDFAKSDTDPWSIAGKVSFLSLEGAWPLLAFLPDRPDTASLRALAALGQVRDITFNFEQASQDVPPKFAVAGTLEAVSFAPVKRTPGITGLSGQFVATDQNGKLDLAPGNVRFDLPRLFRNPLMADQVDGTLTWTRSAGQWRVASDAVQIRNPDGKASATFALVLPDDATSPVLDLEATVSDLAAVAMPRYLAADRLTAKSLAWFDRAFSSGEITSASIEYHGPMRRFPFRDGSGDFIARGQFENLTIDYAPGWTPLTGVSGDVEFHNAGLVAHATGQVHGLQLTAGELAIADLKSTELDIRGTAKGDLGAALDYLQHSTVGPQLGERFMALEGKGETVFDARLWLPLKRRADRKIDVTAQLANAEVGQRDLAQKLTELSGPLQVVDRALVSPGLQGRFLGGPVSLVMTAEARNSRPSATVVTANGRALAASLKEFLNIPEVVKLSGAAAWRMQARFLPGQQSYSFDSDLQGLGIDLPQPVQKAAGAMRPLHVDVELESSLTVRGSLGELRSVTRLQREGGQWTFDRAGVRADGIAAAIPDHEGIRIEGELESFVLDEWLALKGAGPGATGGRKLRDYLKAANVTIGTFDWLGYEWNDVRGLMQATAAGWKIDVAGPDAAGELLVPYDLAGTAPLTFEMEHLVLTPKRKGTRGSTMDPRQLPPIQARINEFELGGRQLGTLRAQLDRVPRGLTISSLTAQGSSFTAEITGSWLAQDPTPAAARGVMTDLEASLASMDVQSTFKALGYGDVMTGSRGLLQAKLNWAGGPDAEALGRASGTVHLEIDDGQLLELQPGAGRVLGLLSVAALPRRLSLDFSDLTDKGLAFDSVRGDFELRLGNAYTNNLLLTGPAADIGIAGRTGLGTRDYDQTAVVTGNIGATLPVAGVLAGGPVVGAAMLLFSQVFKEPLNGITRGYYHITGPWDEPQVERVLASDAKEAAAHPSSPAIPVDSPPESSTSP